MFSSALLIFKLVKEVVLLKTFYKVIVRPIE